MKPSIRLHQPVDVRLHIVPVFLRRFFSPKLPKPNAHLSQACVCVCTRAREHMLLEGDVAFQWDCVQRSYQWASSKETYAWEGEVAGLQLHSTLRWPSLPPPASTVQLRQQALQKSVQSPLFLNPGSVAKATPSFDLVLRKHAQLLYGYSYSPRACSPWLRWQDRNCCVSL